VNKLKVLFHINDPERWPRVLLNITNFINDAGPANVAVEVVANGGAVLALTGERADQKLQGEMERLAGQGIVFSACRNALRMHSLDEGKLPPYITVVPAGITEIAQKQAGGFAYIKP